MLRFMLATRNRHKLGEFALILTPYEVVAMPGGIVLPPEGTTSFAANAHAKAVALREAVLRETALREAVTASRSADDQATEADARPVAAGDLPDFFIADDSGLEVEALGWAPGVMSSRYCGREGDDAANIAKLLHELRGRLHEDERRARFVCAVACVTLDARHYEVRGEWWGHIALAPRGKGGFGYDPVFVPNGSTATVAEWPAAEKNEASHRARAGRALVARLRREGALADARS
jgi:XTP/dITP diphosphohydrolase